MGENHIISSVSGTHVAYFVEICGVLDQPFQHPSGFVVTKDWQRFPARVVPVDRETNHGTTGRIGDVPVRNLCHESDHLDLMNFEAAYTLACLLQAQSSLLQGVCCRIVEVKVEYSWNATEVRASPEISLSEVRREVKFKPFDSTLGMKEKDKK
jgi:hypothetical protein